MLKSTSSVLYLILFVSTKVQVCHGGGAVVGILKNTTDCKLRNLAYEYAGHIQPGRQPHRHVFDALELETLCDLIPPPPTPLEKQSRRTAENGKKNDKGDGVVFYADAVNGDDANAGTVDAPFASIGAAVDATRRATAAAAKTVVLRGGGGVFYLPSPIALTPADSHLTIESYEGEEVWISGAVPLDGIEWSEYNVTDGGMNIWVADVPPALVGDITGLHTFDSESTEATASRLTRARYPNADNPEIRSTVKSLNGDQSLIEWTAPPKRGAAQQVFVNLSSFCQGDRYDPSMCKNNSGLDPYNTFVNGRCESAFDEDCPCGMWADQRDGEWYSESYWCSNASAGGWSEMDRGNGFYNGPILPRGLTYNKTSELTARMGAWSNASGAILTAWRAQGWFVNMFEVGAHDREAGTLSWGPLSGGWQGGRGWQLNGTTGSIEPLPSWYIENVREELDQAGEFFFDRAERKLYVFYNDTASAAGGPPSSIDDARFVVPVQTELFGLRGKQGSAVVNVTLKGLNFRDSRYTYMEPWGVPSGGDWSLYRGAALFAEGTEGLTVEQCKFSRVDGNAFILSGYNRDALIDDNEFEWIGDTAMAAWGYTDDYDGTGGDQPRGITVSNNFAREVGVYELQSSMWFQAKSAEIRLVNNIFFNGPRSGINFNDGFGGANNVSENLIFNTCRQSGDHGPINSWDRQPFLTAMRDGETPSFAPADTTIANNYIIANYGGSQGVDNDDGSSYYDIHHNVFYGEGLKQDYGGSDSKYWENLNYITQYDGQNCINTWPFVSEEHGHDFHDNKCIVSYTDAYGTVSGCNVNAPSEDFDVQQGLRDNQYFTPFGNASLNCGGTTISLAELQANSSFVEAGSTVETLPSDEEIIAWAQQLLGMDNVVDE